MLKGGDLQNQSKVGLNMCFTADLYHWKSNCEHFLLKFTGLAKKKKKKEKTQTIFEGKKEI